MSNSLWPHEPQHARPPCPSPTARVHPYSIVSDSLQPHALYSPWNSPGQNTGVGSLSLLQGIFPTQGSNPGLPHCRQILHQLSHQGSPRILEWLAYPFPGAVPDSGIKPGSLALQADSLPAELPGKPTWPSKPKIFIWSFIENVCQHLFLVINLIMSLSCLKSFLGSNCLYDQMECLKGTG